MDAENIFFAPTVYAILRVGKKYLEKQNAILICNKKEQFREDGLIFLLRIAFLLFVFILLFGLR